MHDSEIATLLGAPRVSALISDACGPPVSRALMLRLASDTIGVVDRVPKALLFLSFTALTVVLAVAIFGCATGQRSLAESDTLGPSPLEQRVAEPGILTGDDALSPQLVSKRPVLERRLSKAHARFGRGRPAVTRTVLGELGPGGEQVFNAHLIHDRCYSIIAVGISNDQVIDMVLLDQQGHEVEQDLGPGSTASLAVCLRHDARYQITIRMYRGHGAFAIRIYGS